MKLNVMSHLDKRGNADVIVVPFIIQKKKVVVACKECDFTDLFSHVLKSEDFKGKSSAFVTLYPGKGKEQRVILLGLGDEGEITHQTLRTAAATVTKECRNKKMETVNFILPELSKIDPEIVALAISEGIFLANYSFDKHKVHLKEDEKHSNLKEVTFITGFKQCKEIAEKALTITQGVNLARDLVNDNADTITPQHLGQIAKKLSNEFPKIKTTVFNKTQIEKEKMGLLLAVSRGGPHDPAFIVMEYKGNPSSSDFTAIIGKGITYDTGGLNLKPTGYMETMRTDMSGSAAVLGTMKAIAALGLKVNVYGVIPSTENAIGPLSYKPGDVYTSHAGKTVEISNTDAEGRLVLADAISYTVKHLKPSRIIDLATLTGAIVVALGEETIGLFSNNDELVSSLKQAGEDTFERVWQLPTYPEYKEHLKSPIADMRNCGTGRSAGSITAALFLEDFVEGTPWAHLDIAGTAFAEKPKLYSSQATGVGVRLLVQFLENLKQAKK